MPCTIIFPAFLLQTCSFHNHQKASEDLNYIALVNFTDLKFIWFSVNFYGMENKIKKSSFKRKMSGFKHHVKEKKTTTSFTLLNELLLWIKNQTPMQWDAWVYPSYRNNQTQIKVADLLRTIILTWRLVRFLKINAALQSIWNAWVSPE